MNRSQWNFNRNSYFGFKKCRRKCRPSAKWWRFCLGLNILTRNHDYVIKWKHFPRYWPFAQGIHRSPVNSPRKDQWRGDMIFSLICTWMDGWVNNRNVGDLRRHRTHYYVTVMMVFMGFHVEITRSGVQKYRVKVMTSWVKWYFFAHTCAKREHYDDVKMGVIGSQITSLTIVYSTVYSGADQSKHQSSASLAFVWGIHRGPVNSPHKWPVTRKMFPFDDVIMKFDGHAWSWKNIPTHHFSTEFTLLHTKLTFIYREPRNQRIR